MWYPRGNTCSGINHEYRELSTNAACRQKSIRIYVYVLQVRFPMLHKKPSGISLPCLLLLFKHSYGLLVFGVGPAICCLTLYWVPFTCGLAVNAEPFQGKLLALGSQDGVTGAVSYLGYGWTRWRCKVVALKEIPLRLTSFQKYLLILPRVTEVKMKTALLPHPLSPEAEPQSWSVKTLLLVSSQPTM